MIEGNVHSSSRIESGVTVEPTARVGPNCYLEGEITIESHARLIGGITWVGSIVVGRGSVVEPGVCLASAKTSASKESSSVNVGQNAHIGAGSVLLSGVRVGNHAWIEPGTVVTRNVPAYAIVGGNPATISGYVADSVTSQSRPAPAKLPESEAPGVFPCSVEGVTLHQFARIRDLRGDLSVGEFERNVPFLPKRYFIVYDVPSSETRGEHAHRQCHQFLICVSGSVSVVVDDGIHREEMLLNGPNHGLFIPAGIWGVQYRYSPTGTLLVFASEYYDAGDYIRNYDDFLRFKGMPA